MTPPPTIEMSRKPGNVCQTLPGLAQPGPMEVRDSRISIGGSEMGCVSYKRMNKKLR